MKFAASTNKAATLLDAGAETLHRIFALRIQENYKTGTTTTVTTPKSKELISTVLVIDEASMVDPKVAGLTDKLTNRGCKIIYTGDDAQLAPIGYEKPFVFSQGFPSATLTEPMRQDKDSHLFKSCETLRDAVYGQKYQAISRGEGVHFVNQKEFLAKAVQAFQDQEDTRILAFSNRTVEKLNGYIRKQLGHTGSLSEGDVMVAANNCGGALKVEQAYRVTSVSGIQNTGIIPFHWVSLQGVESSVKCPADKFQYFKMVKRARAEGKSSGDWTMFFDLQNQFADIRDGFACTTHKAQGGTYPKVFINFQDMTSCQDLNTFLRMLYVAVSRAKVEVYIYGL